MSSDHNKIDLWVFDAVIDKSENEIVTDQWPALVGRPITIVHLSKDGYRARLWYVNLKGGEVEIQQSDIPNFTIVDVITVQVDDLEATIKSPGYDWCLTRYTLPYHISDPMLEIIKENTR